MSGHVGLLDAWETELQAVEAQSEAREADLSVLLVKTAAHWKTWAEQWQAVLHLLEERQGLLEAKSGEATEMVTMTEGSLAETEAALREWLAAAQAVARQLAPR